MWARIVMSTVALGAFGGRCTAGESTNVTTTDTWFHDNPLARELSQLTAHEFRKFAATDLLDVRPVVLPTPKNILGENDYYMWPIATMVDGTVVVLYARSPCHWGPDSTKGGGRSGIRMVVTSDDGGRTWSTPVDVLQAGRWARSPFKGFGAGLGVHEGVVYLALNQGVYRSQDKGKSWELASDAPTFDGVPEVLWAPGMRLTVDEVHGLTVWTTSGFSQDSKARMQRGEYGTHMVAVYSPDFGATWRHEAQALPDGLRLSEVTPVQFDGKIAFFLRNGFKNVHFGQGYSGTGWFPFQFALSDVGPVGIVDTPDIAYNPVTRRLEVAAPHRRGTGPGPTGGMKVNLYSMSPSELAGGKTQWRYDGTLVRYKNVFGKSDGFNPVGSVIDAARGKRVIHVWGGDCTGKAGIFQYSVDLDTPAVRRYLMEF